MKRKLKPAVLLLFMLCFPPFSPAISQDKPGAPHAEPARGEGEKGKDSLRKQAVAPASLTIEMSSTQPADAPVILLVKLTNTSGMELSGYFDQNIRFRAFLSKPDGIERQVAVTNGSQIVGSFGPPPRLRPGESAVIPLRLTTYPLPNQTDYLPSESVYLPPGNYRLRLERLFWDRKPSEQTIAQSRVTFTVVKDAALTKARWEELMKSPKDMQEFAKHVLEATLTPEIRKEWYRDIMNLSPRAGWRLQHLGYVQDPPPDVTAGILEAMKFHIDHPDISSRDQVDLLNIAAAYVLEKKPDGAGPLILKLALGRFDPNDRSLAIMALQFYYQDDMADKLAALLMDDDKRVPVRVARLLAWAGDDRCVDFLIDAARKKNPLAAAALAYLPSNTAAAKALETALASDDKDFVESLKKTIAWQSKNQPARAARKR